MRRFSNSITLVLVWSVIALNTAAVFGQAGPTQAEKQQPPAPVVPDYKAPLRPLPSMERVGVNAADQTPLSLDDAIALVLTSNKDINASRIDVRMSEFDLTAAKGVFDPKLTGESYYERRNTPVASLIGGGGGNGAVLEKDQVGALHLSGFTPAAGGSYQIDFSSSRVDTNNLFAALNPQYPSALTFTYTQPLWRGRKTDDNRRRIEVAKKNLSLSDIQFRLKVIEIITHTEQSYWDLVFALKNLEVQNNAVKEARAQVESNRRMVEKGALAPIDVVAAETQVSNFEQNVYTAQESVTRAENALKQLILPDRTAPLWSRAILPVTPVVIEPPQVPLEQAVATALNSRSELAQLETSKEINTINTKFYRDQTKPQIDLVGSYSTAGLAGPLAQNGPNPFTAGNQALLSRVNELSALAGLNQIPPTPLGSIAPGLIGGYDQSLSNLFGLTYPTTHVGVRLSLPLRNRTAEANLGRSLAQAEQIENQRQQLEQSIEADVRNATQSLRSAQARLAAASSARSTAEQQYQSEERKFQAGESTVFLVLQRQTDLFSAQGRELQAATDLNKAISEYQRVVGSTLQVHNVTLQVEKTTP